ncbi:MAG TPA: RsmE family RNA methyltransferase [Vicinamibacterales bacterium]
MLGVVNLIVLESYEVDDAGTARLTGARATHVVEVLKARVGQRLRIGRLNGPLGTGTVMSADEGAVSLACQFEAAPPPQPRVDLLLALPRPKVLRRLWSQLAAIGVGHIILTNAARVERHYFDSHVLEVGTYAPLLIEGLQQAQDTWLPRVSIHRRFKVLIEDDLDGLCPSGARLVAHPGEGQSIGQALGGARDARVLLAVGPEGGWVTFERDLLVDRGFHVVELGQRSLRSDTATIALLTLVHDALRHMG